MGSRIKPRTVLLTLLIACVVSTAIHYTDNTLNIDQYPKAGPVNATVVALTWLMLTPAAILGYRLYADAKMLPAYGVLAVYAFVGLSTPAHYTSSSFEDFAAWRNASILTDGVTGAALLAFVPWSILVAREWSHTASPPRPSFGSPAG